MDTHLEEMLRDGMKRQTESVSLPEDLLSRAVGRYYRRKTAVGRLVAGGGAVGVVALAAGLVFGVALPQAADQPSPSPVASRATAPVSTTGPALIEAVPVALVLQKTVALMTVAEGEVLHVKATFVDHKDGSTVTREIWSTSGTNWKYRSIVQMNGRSTEISYDSTGLIREYDPETNSISERHDEAAKRKVPPANGEYQEGVQRLLDSGQAVEDGREQVDGRDAIRILEERPAPEGERSENAYLVDAQTGAPIEWRIGNEGENRIIHFEVYEKLPGTPENLELLDLTTAHSDAAV
jgi:hypothetical protein